MIKRVSHFSLFVIDQEAALKFYTEKLGCSLSVDTYRGDFRWTTVIFPGAPETEIILVPIKKGPLFDQKTADALADLVRQGTFGAAVFYTENIHATYLELSEKGVHFLQEPEEINLGIEALFEDNSGNWFSLLQPK